MTAANAYARAMHQFVEGGTGAAAKGLSTFDSAAARKERVGEPVLWKLARARYLDMTLNAGDRAGVDAAAIAWRDLGNQFPENLTVQTAIASARAVQGNWEVMSQAVDRLHTLTGDSGLQWRLAQGRMYIQCARNQDDYVKGSLELSKLVKDVPGLAEPHVLLARALDRLGRADGAIEHLQTATQLDPSSASTGLDFAAQLVRHGEFDRAQIELDRISPLLNSVERRRAGASLYAGANAPEKGAALMEQTRGDTTATKDLFMAMLYRKEGKLDKAEDLVKTLLEQPDLATVQFAADLYLSQGRKADAEKALAMLDGLKLEPALKELIWGSYYLRTGSTAEAIKQYQAAVKIAPNRAVTWRTMAAVYMYLGMRDQAVTAIRDAAKALPEDTGLAAEVAHVDLIRESLDDQGLIGVTLAYHRDPLAGDAALEMMRLVTDARRAQRHAPPRGTAPAIHRTPRRLHARLHPPRPVLPGHGPQPRRHDRRPARHDRLHQRPRTRPHRHPGRRRLRELDRNAPLCGILEKRSQDPGADVALARALAGLGQYAAARDQLQSYIANAKANPDQFAGVLSVYASALVNLGMDKDAEAMLWPLAQKDTNCARFVGGYFADL